MFLVGNIHASETQRALELNVGRGGMKRLMEEAAVRHAETIHYSASAGIRILAIDAERPRRRMIEEKGSRPRGKTSPRGNQVE